MFLHPSILLFVLTIKKNMHSIKDTFNIKCLIIYVAVFILSFLLFEKSFSYANHTFLIQSNLYQDYGAHIPIIINSSAGNVFDNSGSLNTTSITSVGFWVGGVGVLTTQMGFGSLWLMDKTVIAGGNIIEPIIYLKNPTLRITLSRFIYLHV